MNKAFVVLFVCGSMFASGCGLLEMGRDVTTGTLKAFKPSSRDYGDADIEVDSWDMRQEARGDQAMTHESDSLSRWIDSDKSRKINKSLGVD